MSRRCVIVAGLSVALLLTIAAMPPCAAEEFPNRTIRMIVPFAPGGGVDVLARLIGQRLGVAYGKPVVVENHPGGTGLVAAQIAGSAPADGHTILVGAPSTFSVLPALKGNLPFNNLADFMPITLIGTAPEALVVNPAVAANSVPELIALLKANPKKLNFGNTGPGGLPHLSTELFMQMSGTEVTHVPYRGTAPVIADVISGHLQGTIDAVISQVAAIKEGRLRALGVTTLQRSPALPDVPAINEFLPGYEAIGWVGLFAPRGTPGETVRKLHSDVRRALQESEVQQRLAAAATVPDGRPPEEFAAFIRRDVERWRKVGTAANVKLD